MEGDEVTVSLPLSARVSVTTVVSWLAVENRPADVTSETFSDVESATETDEENGIVGEGEGVGVAV